MAGATWLYLSLRRTSIKTPRSFRRLHCLFICSSSFNPVVFISGQSRVIDGRGEEEVRFSGASSFPFSRLFHSSIYHPHRHVSLQHSSTELLGASLGFRGFSSGSSDVIDGYDDEIESECDNDVIDEIGVSCVESSTNAEEVERVCKVIAELFAFDRNMEAVLDEMKVDLSHDLIIEVLERFRHAWKPAFRFFCWAAEKPGFAHDSRTYNSMMSILAKTRQFETMVSVLEEMGTKGLS